MRIKSLEISGFKSFAARARLQFGEGITGVVGPNGCGKSNVVDAIRWVLGEMSAKHLRGRGMQDVIFAGSQGRAAQNMAEVTLTFLTDGDVPAQYRHLSEMAVTRRLFRDGTSEYLLNKQAVRLRDIVDLFLGTGVGTRAYSIIEQGRIGFVVSARPEERRGLIEEVAGISKYKSRKKAAERRMAATEQNLARVRDVLGELDRQLGSLREQAERARTYKALKESLYTLELHRATYEFLRLRLLLGREQRLSAELLERSEQAADRLTREEAASDDVEATALAAEAHVAELQKVSMAAHAAFVATERDLSHWQEQALQLASSAARARAQNEQLAERLVAAQAEQAERGREAEQAAGRREELVAGLASLGEALAASTAEVERLDGELAALRRQALAKVQAAAEQQSRLAALNARASAAGERHAQQQAEQATLAEQLAEAERATAAQSEQVAAERAEREREQAAFAALGEQEAALAQQVAAASQAVRAQQQALGQQAHRLGSLEDIVRRLDGYADGVRVLLQGEVAPATDGPAAQPASPPKHLSKKERRAWQAEQARASGGAGAKPGQAAASPAAPAVPAPTLSGLRGVVAEVLEVPPEHEQAIEAVLGERLQYVRVAGRADAHAAMAWLAEQQAGRSGFVPAELTPCRALPAALGAAHEGVLGFAHRLVRPAPGAEALCEALLGHVVLVDSLAAAEAAASAHRGMPCVWATPQGELVDGQGLLQGGAHGGHGLLANRREIRQLKDDVLAGEAALQSAEADLARLEQTLGEVRSTREAARAALHRRELALATANKGLEASEQEQRRLARSHAALGEALANSRTQIDRVQAELAEAVAAASTLSGESDEDRARLTALEAARAAAAARQAAESADCTEQRIAERAHAERAQAARAAAERLGRAVADMQAEQAAAAEQAEASQAQAQQLEAQAHGGQGSLGERARERDQASERQQAAEAALAEARARAKASQEALRAGRREQAAMQAALSEHRLLAQTFAAEQTRLVQHIAERHDVDLCAELLAFHSRPAPSQAARKEEQRLARALKAMGAINLTAIEECERIEQRTLFLRAQQEDLEAALTALRDAVHRIDQDSRERFEQAFVAVDEMFQKMYPRLFGGGSAKLVLTEADGEGEAGIDMVAMPPGKKLQNVSLLSGGEKALTATALVFAIFLIKPSPFCILDEVDAPLDEANVGRFNDTLREMSKLSQFIVITHNKNTMLQMDRLFGITMEDAGLSKVVAVDLDDQRPGTQAA